MLLMIRILYYVMLLIIRILYFLMLLMLLYYVINLVFFFIFCFICEDYLMFWCKLFVIECVNICMIWYRDGKLEFKCIMVSLIIIIKILYWKCVLRIKYSKWNVFYWVCVSWWNGGKSSNFVKCNNMIIWMRNFD